MSTKPERRVDPSERLLSSIDDLKRAVLQFVAFLPVFAYFFVFWKYRDQVRVWLRRGALGVLSLTLAIFLGEVILEFAGNRVLAEIKQRYPNLEGGIVGFFVLSGLIILWHNIVETKHGHTEAALSDGLWRLFYGVQAKSKDELTKQALKLVAEVFQHFGCCSACIWTLGDDGLRIVDDHWHPSIPLGYVNRLPIGAGIAGLVHEDRLPRYVPRLFFPFNRPVLRLLSWRFPHALVFAIHGRQGGIVDVSGREFSPNAVHFDHRPVPESMMSFVSVPLSASATGPSHGVLCINFKGTNTLDTIAIKMASVLGVVVAEKLDRLETALAVQGALKAQPVQPD
ncbi:MAG: hypothetical protein KGI35_07885 [Burkholderiales bacterium]|nr:hypothetical protein [Burkholderiales bacterium]